MFLIKDAILSHLSFARRQSHFLLIMNVFKRNPKVLKTAIDLICISCLLGLLFVKVTPPHKGFACNDATIRLPMKKSSISTNAVFAWGYVVPVALIIVVETLAFLRRRERSVSRTLKAEFIWILWNELLIFFLRSDRAAAADKRGKGTIGKLRPTFFAVCRPENFTCSEPAFFVQEYTCGNRSDEEVEDVRSSFFSSHSSFSFYIAVYTILYHLHTKSAGISSASICQSFNSLWLPLLFLSLCPG